MTEWPVPADASHWVPALVLGPTDAETLAVGYS